MFSAFAAAVFLGSVAATVYFCRSMPGGMRMPGGWTMSMIWMPMPGQQWLASGMMFLLMWLAMMVAMMLPATAPMLLQFRRSLADQHAHGPGISTMLVACGYFAVWMALGIPVYIAGVLLAAAAMRWTSVSSAAPALTGATLVVAGLLQLGNWKRTGLGHCRSPFTCGAYENTSGWRASWTLGIRQGLYCALCCCGPMLALLAIGMMNLFAMLAVTIVIVAEKVLPDPRPVTRIAGILAIFSGIAVAVSAMMRW